MHIRTQATRRDVRELAYRGIMIVHRPPPDALANETAEMDKAVATNKEPGHRTSDAADWQADMLGGDMDEGCVTVSCATVGNGISHIRETRSREEIVDGLTRDSEVA